MNYQNIATDCDIIIQKIEGLQNSLRGNEDDRAVKIEEALSRALNAALIARAESI